jgi:pimeloyl-ACP methyl ester carboxylesterase
MSDSLLQAKLATIARTASQRKSVFIDGLESVYWFYPKRNQKSRSKESIVFIHGYRGNHHGLEAIAGGIEDFDIYIPDLPGFGQSEAFGNNHSVEHYADWLNRFLSSLGFSGNKPHLLGHSFGSIVVSAYAAKYDGIKTLILENPVASPALKGPKAAMTLVAKGFFWLAGVLPENLGDGILKSWPMVRGMSIIMTKSRVKELRAWVHRQHDENFNDYASRRVALEGYTASISNCVSDYAKDFRVPVLMMIGEKDDITSVGQQERLLQLIGSKQKQLDNFPSVGHLTHYEIPTIIAETIRKWVTAND